MSRDAVAATEQPGCRACDHRRRPGLADPGYCGERTDTPPAYGPGHPLHQLPDDEGATCQAFTPFRN